MVLGIAPSLLEGALQVGDGREEPRVHHGAEVGRLVNDARDNVVVRDWGDLSRRVALLLPNDVQDRLLERNVILNLSNKL